MNDEVNFTKLTGQIIQTNQHGSWKISRAGAGFSTLIEPHDEIAKEIFRFLGKNQIFPHITIYNPKHNKHGPHITQNVPGNGTQREYMRHGVHGLGIPPHPKTIKLLQNIYKLMENMEKTDRAERKNHEKQEKKRLEQSQKNRINTIMKQIHEKNEKKIKTKNELNSIIKTMQTPGFHHSLRRRKELYSMNINKFKNLLTVRYERGNTNPLLLKQNIEALKQIMKYKK